MKKCTQINYNWFCSTQNGEEFSTFTVGINNVKSIYVGMNPKQATVTFDNNTSIQVNNVNMAYFNAPIESKSDLPY